MENRHVRERRELKKRTIFSRGIAKDGSTDFFR